jgi:hypothetical protein
MLGRIAAVPALVALVTLSGVGAASAAKAPRPPPPRYLFAGVPWLVPGDTARVHLAERGYRHVPAASDSQQTVLRGKLFDHDALVTGYLDEKHRLLRWVVLIATRGDPFPYPDMRAVYDEATQEAKGRYGSPRSLTERYRFPYQRDDGREDHALRDGLATIRTVWESKSGDRLTIEMDANVSVVLTYECREWAEFRDRRQAKRATDL